MKLMRFLLAILLIALSQYSFADVVLLGNMNIGDNSTSAIKPTILVAQNNNNYTPGTHPIHFSLSQAGTVTQITANNLVGNLYGLNFVIWNSSGQIVVNQTASESLQNRISGAWSLAAGDYQMAVWGQCTKKGDYSVTSYSSCLNSNGQQEWDDISYTNITLTGINSSSVNYIQRLHIGDNTDTTATRWYPPSPSTNVSVSNTDGSAAISSNSTGSSVTYSFAVTTDMLLAKLSLFNMTDWQTAGASRIQLRVKNSSTYLWQYSFTGNGDLTWEPNLTLSPGNYELIISTDDSNWTDADDISWNDVVISLQPVAVDPACAALFPYPVQGRNSTGTIDFGGGYNTGPAGLVYGTSNGKIGFSTIRNINTVNQNNGNCDGQVCVFDAYAKSMTLSSNPFPTSGSKSITVDYSYSNYTKTLTAADGTAFGSVTLYNGTYLNITNPGITIKNLVLNSGVTTVYLAAGEYWIDSITLNSGAQIVLNGDVKLHVKTLTMQSSSYINSPKGVYNPTAYQGGDPSKLLLIMYGSLSLGNNAILSGMIYRSDYNSGGTDISMASTSYIFGRVNANSIAMTWGSTIYGANQQCPAVTINTASSVNHYEIRYPSSQITCEPASVTINACTNSATSSCTLDQTATSTVTLSAPSSTGFTNPITLTKGTATIALNHYATGSVTLGLSNTSAYTCFKNDVIDSTCQLPFVATAFSFNIPTFYAGSDSGNVTMKALQASATTPAVCTTLFANQTQYINFSSQYVLPTTGSKSPTLNGATITSNTSVPVTFDNLGVGTIKLAYNDAGVLGISAQYTKTDTTAGTLSISGSDNVAVLPPQIQLTAVGQTACSGSDDQTYAACSAYKKAGETFTLSAQAGYGTSFVSTNNFTPESTAVKPSIEHKLLAPSTGTLSSSWTNSALTFSAGIASSSVSEGDVGVYKYQVNPFVPYPTYQDETTKLTVPKSTDDWSDPVGRFIPAQLKAALVANGSLTTDSCVAANQTSTTLGYTGQPLRFATAPMLSVTALGSDGSTIMKNYLGEFAKITNMKVPGSANFVVALIPKNSANSLTSTASWSDGTWSTPGNAYTPVYTFSANDQFTFAKTSTPVSPFATSLLVSALTDSDGVAATSSLPLTFNPLAPDGSAFNVYSGRLLLDNANGSESSALTMPFYLQYWNGSAYALNSSDNCSSLSTSYLQMNGAASWSGIKLKTSSTTTGSSAATTATLSPALVAQGSSAIQFTAPNASGWVDVAAGSGLPLWMQDLAQTSGLTPARASFGYYRGNDRLIYRREVFGN